MFVVSTTDNPSRQTVFNLFFDLFSTSWVMKVFRPAERKNMTVSYNRWCAGIAVATCLLWSVSLAMLLRRTVGYHCTCAAIGYSSMNICGACQVTTNGHSFSICGRVQPRSAYDCCCFIYVVRWEASYSVFCFPQRNLVPVHWTQIDGRLDWPRRDPNQAPWFALHATASAFTGCTIMCPFVI